MKQFRELRVANLVIPLFVLVFVLFYAVQGPAALASQTKIIASATVCSVDDLWKVVEQFGTEMRFKETTRGLKELAKLQAPQIDKFALTKRFGIVAATNGDDVFPFIYIPLKPNAPISEDELNDVKSKIENIIKIKDVAAFVKNETLFITLEKFKDLLPTEIESSESFQTENGETNLLELNVDCTSVPEEFIETLFAVARQKITESIREDDSDGYDSLNSNLEYFSRCIDSLKSFRSQITVDENCDVILRVQCESKKDGVLSELFSKSAALKTRWSSFAETSNLIACTFNYFVEDEKNKEQEKKTLQSVTKKKVLNSLESLIDDPKNLEIAKEIAERFFNVQVAQLDLESVDKALVLSAEPPILVAASNLADPDDFRQALALVVDKIKSDNNEIGATIALNAENIDGFSVSTMDLPVSKLSNIPIEYFQDKEISIRLGVSNDASILVLGLNSDETEAKFKEVVDNSKEFKPIPNVGTFDLALLFKLTYDILATTDELQPVAKKTLETLANSENLKIITERNITENAVTIKTTIQRGFVSALGEIIRINISGGKEDDSLDMDDVFDEQ